MTDETKHTAEELENKLLEVNGEIHEWEAVFASKPWKILEEFGDELLHARREQSELVPPEGLDDLISRNFMQGEISGLRLILQHPKSALEEMKETASALREMHASLEDNDDDD